MDFKLAKKSLDKEGETVSYKDIEGASESSFFYLDKSNKDKKIETLLEKLRAKGKNAECNEVYYGTSDEEYLYEIVIF